MDISGLPVYRPYTTPDYSPYVAKIIAALDSQTAAIMQPADGLRQASASYDVKISYYGQIQSDLAILESAAQILSGPNAFFRFRARSTDPAIFTSYAQGSALPGVYNVEVSQLAQGETLVSAAQHDPATTIGSDLPATVTFRFGNGDSKNITINRSNNTPDSLSAIAASINQAGIGISAQVVADGPDFRLVLKGPSGASNSFSIGVSGDEAISHLLFYSDGATNSAMSQITAAQDSKVRVNGTPINGYSNVLEGVAGGLTVSLKGTGSAAVTVAPDLSQISSAVRSFVDAYNIAQSDIATYLTGELSGDKTLPAVSGQLSSDMAALQSGPNGSAYSQLAQIGITRDQNGVLSFDDRVFQEAYAQNPQGVAHLFTDNGNGLADQIAGQIRDVIQPSGNISSTIDQLLSKIKKNQQTVSNLEDNAFQQLQYSAHQYAQQLAMLIVKQIMDQFLQFTQHQSNLQLAPLNTANQLPSSPLAIPQTLGF